jgi:DNA-directed RNA polymerase subunit RPC12/RpoP
MVGKGKIYKQHYACFDCRKAFKKTNLREVPKERQHVDEQGRVVHCPDCGARMPDVGFVFKPPKKSDVKAWEEWREYLTNTLDYAIRNSGIVNTQSREKLKEFIEAHDETRRSIRGAEIIHSPRRRTRRCT